MLPDPADPGGDEKGVHHGHARVPRGRLRGPRPRSGSGLGTRTWDHLTYPRGGTASISHASLTSLGQKPGTAVPRIRRLTPSPQAADPSLPNTCAASCSPAVHHARCAFCTSVPGLYVGGAVVGHGVSVTGRDDDGSFSQLRDGVRQSAGELREWGRRRWNSFRSGDPSDLVTGSSWTGPRGQERWKLSPNPRRMSRNADAADLTDLVGEKEARRLVAAFLGVRPEGGRVWLDAAGIATTLQGERLVYLGRITILEPEARPPSSMEQAVADALSTSPGLTLRELSRQLRRRDRAVRPEAVTQVLARRADLFAPDQGDVPRWRRRGTAAPPPRPPTAPDAAIRQLLPPAPSRQRQLRAAAAGEPCLLPLLAWQVRAVRAWVSAGSTGVVEAVTGTGKTHVGLEVIARAVASGERSTVLVPTVDLQRQWLERLQTHLPGAEAACLGGVGGGDVERAPVVVALVQSASRTDLTRHAGMTTLVADEVHRYGADSWSSALRPTYTHRLGLTATLERADDGVDRHIRPYFGATVMTYLFEEAITDDVVAPFRLIFAPVAMRPDEQEKYDAETTTLSRALSSIRAVGELRNNRPLPQQLAELTARSDRVGRLARSAAMATTRRRLLLAELEGKLDAVNRLAGVVDSSQGTVIFTQTKRMAEGAAERLRSQNVAAAAMFSGVPDAERQQNLRDLATGTLQALAAPKLLDEGIDVPSVDLGVVLAASRSRRQMVQRLGRVIRRKKDGRAVTFVLVYAPGTVEDPDSGIHDGFFDLVGSIARATVQLPLDWSGGDVQDATSSCPMV